MNRYTPIPPIAPSAEQTSDESSDAGSDDEKTDDDEAELDEDFQMLDKQYEDVKHEMKKRMFELSELDAFDNLVRKLSRCFSMAVFVLPNKNVKIRKKRQDINKKNVCKC